jgi:tRNA(Ile)-lysidine synthase
MVMVHLFATAGYDFGIAHCNFHLRGEESDGDALLVAQQAARYEVPFFTIDFDTKTYASTHKLTIQVAARDLRYNWFGQLLRSEGFDFVATAHHQGDSVETFFINLARGTGIRGLTSIRPKTGNVVRPLLFSTRKQIELYQQVEGVRYREDSSNASLKYVRNKIRHDIVPRFEDIFDNYSDAVVKNIDRLREIEMVYMSAIDTARASS